MKEQFTQEEWLNDGTTVYALQDSVWLGKPSKENRFQFSIQGKCSDEELLANAVLAKAAPKMYRKLKEIADNNFFSLEINDILAEARGEVLSQSRDRASTTQTKGRTSNSVFSF